MLQLCSFPQSFQPIQVHQGDWVRYIGTDPKIQQDYGYQDLQLLAVERGTGITVCATKAGNRLVGVSVGDLQQISGRL